MAAARHAYNEREHVEPEAEYVPTFGRTAFLCTGGSVLRHRGCDFGNLAGRSFMQIAKARGWTGAVVYFDAITAFAAMLRAPVCHHQCSRDHPTAGALMASGFSADEVATMSREVLHAPAREKMPQSPHLRRLLSDALSSTCAATRRGSKAGEHLADLAFGMLMRRILQRVGNRMDDLGLVARQCGATPFPPADDALPETEAVHDISCVDDASAYT